MINHSGICMDYIYYLYTSTKYIKCFNEHLVHIEAIMDSTSDMVQTLGLRIKSIFNNNESIEIQFWLGKKWPEFVTEIEKMMNKDYVLDENSFAMQLFKKVLDSVISHIQNQLEITSSFNSKIILDDGDYDFILGKDINHKSLVEAALIFIRHKQEKKSC